MNNDTPNNAFYETLDQIDVFTLLGMSGSDEEKAAYLAQMQQSVWNTAIEEGILPMLTQAQLAEVEDMMADESVDIEVSRGLVFEFLLKINPDLPELIKEKILEFKGEILVSRIEGLRERYQGNPSELQRLDSIELMLEEGNVQPAIQALAAL
jgi:hypothetical protein